MLDRIPPNSIDAEQSLLGALLLDNSRLPDVIEIIDGSEFYRDSHLHIYAAIRDLFEKNSPADIVTVCELLSSRAQVELAGGASYVASLANNMSSALNAISYASIIAEKAQARRLIQAANETLSACYSGQNTNEVAEAAEAAIFAVTGKRMGTCFSHVREVVRENLEIIEQGSERKDLSGVPSGYRDLDRLTGGFQKSDLIILAGRPSMGKTALALCIARNAARRNFTAGFFSLEMSKRQLGFRLLCMEARVDLMRAITGSLSRMDSRKLVAAALPVGEYPILIDDTAALSPLELKAKARRMASSSGLDLIVVDYLQLMRGQNKERREQEISEISRSLKALAKELDLPVIALSQLSRKVEERADRRPIMSDLRESGAIEQDADVILFIYRDEVYNRESPDLGIAEVIIGKQRNGPTGLVKLAYLDAFTRFESLSLGG